MTKTSASLPFELDAPAVAEFCRKWHIAEMSLFGSVLRDDFKADSDVDVLIAYVDGHGLTRFEKLKAVDELSEIFGRKVDMVSRSALEHWSVLPKIRSSIFSSAEVVYALPR